MEKEALIDIILNDIKEAHALVKTFKGKQELNAAFINLTRTKIANINEELNLLEQLNAKKVSTDTNESSLTSQLTEASVQENNAAIAESSSRFVAGESNMEAKSESVYAKPSDELTKDIDTDATKPAEPTKHSDTETMAVAGHTKHSDTESLTVEDNTKPARSETSASDTETMTATGHTKHSGTESLTGAGDTKPARNETSASDTETMTAAGHTKHSDTESLTGAGDTMPARNETSASDTNALKSENKALESEPKTKEVVNAPAVGTTRKNKKPGTKKSVLGEVINQEASSVNDVLANKKEVVEDIKQIGKPVDDVKKAFGLNDRFYYQRELFNNNAGLFNQTLEQINSMETYDTAISFLQSNYNWEANNEACEAFFRSIKRRFI